MKISRNIFTAIGIFVLICGVLFSMSACSSGDSNNNGPYKNEYINDKYAEDGSESDEIVVTSDRLIVYYVDLDLSNKNPKELKNKIATKLNEIGGYVQSTRENESNGYYNIVVRVPTEKLNDFLSIVEKDGEVNSKIVTSQDITQQYTAVVEKKVALETEQTRLENMLTSDQTLSFDNKMTIEKRLTEISTLLDRYTTEMNNFKNQADYSTVTINLYKTGEYVEPSYWDRLGEVFFGSGLSVGTVFGWILTVIVAILPYFAVIAGLFGLYVLIKFIICKVRKKPFELFARARGSIKFRKERKALIRQEFINRQRQIVTPPPTHPKEEKADNANDNISPEN